MSSRALSKVPEITVYFWIIKILTTAMGEATSDYMVHRLNPYLAVGFGFVAFAVAMALQFKAPSYVPWVYWLAVLMVAVFGTMAADVLHVEFGVPYLVSSLVFAVGLAVVFGAWYRSEGTLSIHSIYTRRRETFYWAAVLATFAMGTDPSVINSCSLRDVNERFYKSGSFLDFYRGLATSTGFATRNPGN